MVLHWNHNSCNKLEKWLLTVAKGFKTEVSLVVPKALELDDTVIHCRVNYVRDDNEVLLRKHIDPRPEWVATSGFSTGTSSCTNPSQAVLIYFSCTSSTVQKCSNGPPPDPFMLSTAADSHSPLQQENHGQSHPQDLTKIFFNISVSLFL